MQGMALLVKVGSPEEFPKPPSYFPTCGGYRYQPAEQQCPVSQANKPNILLAVLLFSTIILLLHV